MVGIILATHGNFAPGIAQSASMIFGEQPNVAAVTLQPNEGPADIRRKMEEAVAGFENQDEVLIMVDLWGGTPFNQANGYIDGHEDKWAIVAGLNLPMLIEAYGQRMMGVESAQEIAKALLPAAKDGVRIYPASLEPKEEKKIADKEDGEPVGVLPPGTVVGDGKIKIVLARVDTRLLHGQVATAWTKTTQPKRIIVCSDGVAHDKLRKSMIIEAAPPGVKANVIPIWKMIEVSKDPRFGRSRVMLLFETPQDALEAIKGGVQIETLNIGSMAHSQGKVAVNKVLSLDAKDIETFEELKKLGIEFDVRKVPSDSKENIEDILNKARAGLGL